MYKNIYMFPAIFYYDIDGISISFPDLPGCLTCASTDEEALYMAKDVLKGFLLLMEEDKEDIPVPTTLKELDLKNNEYAVLIEVNLSIYKKQKTEKIIKKTLTIPSWLNDEAINKEINFSKVLKEALIEQLELK